MSKRQERAEALAKAGEDGASWEDIGSLKRDEYRKQAESESVFDGDAYRPILLPSALAFADVLDYLGEYAAVGREGSGSIGGNEIGTFCTVDLSQLGGAKHRSIAVRPTEAAMQAVAGRIVTDDDSLSWRLIAHEGTGRVLVILEHGHIIGSHWLAYIDPATIPAEPPQTIKCKARDLKAGQRVKVGDTFERIEAVGEMPGERVEVITEPYSEGVLWEGEQACEVLAEEAV